MKQIYLSHCSISPLFPAAVAREIEIAETQRDKGFVVAYQYNQILDGLRQAAAELLLTSPDNIAFLKNTTEGMSIIANGYPFAAGDRIISYMHEYPANHYPWRLQENRGAHLDLLPDRVPNTCSAALCPCAWDMNDLEKMITDRTRVVAVSHVQFASGFAANLKELGIFCKDRNIDLVIDAAQSLGCLPIYPEEYHISAIAASGWKWLLGPIGTGLLYISEEFREKVGHSMVGAETMQQGMDYLDHRWQPHQTAKRFEYSTSPISLAAALEVCLRQYHLAHGIENIWNRVSRSVDLIAQGLAQSDFEPILFDAAHRSGILSLQCHRDADVVAHALMEKGVVTTSRAGYLRIAPHFHISDEEIHAAINMISGI